MRSLRSIGTRSGIFYQDTGARKWGRPYLKRSFFTLLGERIGRQASILMLALRGGVPIAGALNLLGERHALWPLLGLRVRKCRSFISSFAIIKRSMSP
jgi:hypothetical protein